MVIEDLTRKRLKVPKRPKAIAILSGSSSSLPPEEKHSFWNLFFFTKCWRLKTKALTNSFKWLKKKHSPPDVWMMSRSCADGCFLAKWGKTILWFLWPPLSRWCVCVATSYEALGTKALVTSSFSSSSSFLQLIIVRLLFCHWVTCKLSLPCLRFRYVSFIFLTEKLTWFRVW